MIKNDDKIESIPIPFFLFMFMVFKLIFER